MALQSSGNISLGDVNVELDLTRTTQISLGQSSVRDLLEVASGAIKLTNGYSKFSKFRFAPTISVNTANYNIKSAAIAAGWDQVKPLQAIVTINSGVYVYSTSVGSYALSTGTTFPSGTTLELINNGTIIGMGGNGGIGGGSAPPYGVMNTVGTAGGPALLAQYAISITNNGSIAGGGGGGGGGGPYSY